MDWLRIGVSHGIVGLRYIRAIFLAIYFKALYEYLKSLHPQKHSGTVTCQHAVKSL